MAHNALLPIGEQHCRTNGEYAHHLDKMFCKTGGPGVFAHFEQGSQRMFGVDGVFVNPLGGQSIVHITNGYDTAIKANFFTRKPVGVTRAIVPLVVL